MEPGEQKTLPEQRQNFTPGRDLGLEPRSLEEAALEQYFLDLEHSRRGRFLLCRIEGNPAEIKVNGSRASRTDSMILVQVFERPHD
jgi:hypothetical protein